MGQFWHLRQISECGRWAAALACLTLSLATAESLLAQQRQAVNVTVHVSDESETPLSYAEVRLYPFGSGSYAYRAFTTAGSVEFPDVGRGNYELVVVMQGYATHRELIEISAFGGQRFSVTLSRLPDSSLATAPGGTVSAAALTVPAAARKQFEAGITALEKDLSGSIGHFQKAIEEYPKYSEAYALLGLAYMRQKQGADAEKAETTAIALDPKLGLAHAVLGKLYLEERKFKEAEPELLESIKLDPVSWEAPFELSRCYFNVGRLDKALEYAQRAGASPHAPPMTHLLLVDIYLRQNDKQDALKELQAFTKEAPQSPLIPRVKQKIEQLSKIN